MHVEEFLGEVPLGDLIFFILIAGDKTTKNIYIHTRCLVAWYRCQSMQENESQNMSDVLVHWGKQFFFGNKHHKSDKGRHHTMDIKTAA